MAPIKLSDPLMDAAQLIEGSRQTSYGSPVENFGRWAALVSAYLGKTLTPEDMAMISVLGKLSRIAFEPKYDSFTDAAGYLAIAAHLHDAKGNLVGAPCEPET